MKNITIRLEQAEEEILAFEVSDDALEIGRARRRRRRTFPSGPAVACLSARVEQLNLHLIGVRRDRREAVFPLARVNLRLSAYALKAVWCGRRAATP